MKPDLQRVTSDVLYQTPFNDNRYLYSVINPKLNRIFVYNIKFGFDSSVKTRETYL